MITIHALVANVHDIPDQALTSVTFMPVPPDHDGQQHPDHDWAGSGQVGFAFEVNVTREAGKGFTPGQEVVITVTEASA